MEIKELKNAIETNTVTSEMMIWKLEDESSLVVATQYYRRIAELKKLNVKVIDSFDEIASQGFIEDDNLYIMKVKDFNEKEINKENCIIICNSTKLNCIKIPKLEQWQFEDYISEKVKGLNRDEVQWLSSQYGVNYFRFLNDMEKISIFEPEIQAFIYKLLLDEGRFKEITSLNIWDLSNSILKKDRNMVKKVLEIIQYIDVEPLGLLTVLYNNFKRVINIQMNPGCTAQDLNISDKQFYAIKKNNCGYYSNSKLVEIFKLLTDLEYKFKFDGLPRNMLIDYMVCKILGEN